MKLPHNAGTNNDYRFTQLNPAPLNTVDTAGEGFGKSGRLQRFIPMEGEHPGWLEGDILGKPSAAGDIPVKALFCSTRTLIIITGVAIAAVAAMIQSFKNNPVSLFKGAGSGFRDLFHNTRRLMTGNKRELHTGFPTVDAHLPGADETVAYFDQDLPILRDRTGEFSNLQLFLPLDN